MSDDASTSTTAPRRRDKPQLSCNACRRRKVRCDRLHPCSNCSSRGLGSSCEFAVLPGTPDKNLRGSSTSENQVEFTRPGTAANMQTRINQLENLVLDLMHQNSASAPRPSQPESRTPQHTQPAPRLSPPEFGSPTQNQAAPTPLESETEHTIGASPSEHGSINIRRARPSYVSSSHWAAIFDSITELRSHFSQEEDALDQPTDLALPLANVPRPQLLYGGLAYETPMSIMKCIPPRPVVDRLISRYFNVLDIAPGMFMG
jgi:hypothetical protein